jgi:hypothetical protein
MNRARAWSVIAAFVCGVDCAATDGRWPSSSACEVHEDCVIAMVAPGPDVCCDITVTAMPIAVANLRASEAYRREHCASASCPPVELPGALPLPCGQVARCIAGACANACDDPTWSPPAKASATRSPP